MADTENDVGKRLPQHESGLFLTDGGLETTLIFHRDIELREFSTLDLLADPSQREILKACYPPYLDVAAENDCGFIIETPTWRASPDWGRALGYGEEELRMLVQQGVTVTTELREQYRDRINPLLISGNVGPRGDGYLVDATMTAQQSADYHGWQITIMASEGVDTITGLTLNYPAEATGIVQAAQSQGLPCVISFTTETDGQLPDGTSLQQAISEVDEATGGGPAYYMINCAHPDHFAMALASDETWVDRIRGIRANASRMTHAELDAAEELDEGNPSELAQLYRQMFARHNQLMVIGGCCGTDHRHVEEALQAVSPVRNSPPS